MNWYLEVLKKYAVFGGRARRKEFWYFALFNFVVFFALTIIDVVIGTINSEIGMGLLGGIYSIAVLIPTIAVSVRRLHDTDRSGWWLLIELIPLLGALVLFIFMALDGQPGENQYGLNPKPENESGPNSVVVVVATIAIVIAILIGIVVWLKKDNYVEHTKQIEFDQNQQF